MKGFLEVGGEMGQEEGGEGEREIKIGKTLLRDGGGDQLHG